MTRTEMIALATMVAYPQATIVVVTYSPTTETPT